MSEVITLAVFMVLIACFAFTPLGYFIYMYTMKNGEPFGDIEPHGDSESAVLKMAENAINTIKGLIAKK
ncbi:MAG: hypothetical protein KGZ80_04640 [Methylomonas sp.]|nr:hypothetical protein [Methylomonas sp.]PPD19476.1 MAG: hypothetical protein CTY23_11700 [Methylomonas sp.]PPD25207.1 MAG: hypothetical protein CTY22_09430 [Methylomonas sp.]PPD34869.1 MAG: hypothetical protein CTY21_09535 [Methylomonas sp.]PPD38038.1 MAG: hypothetical protein CTY17_10020 [Methylomonas sp.]